VEYSVRTPAHTLREVAARPQARPAHKQRVSGMEESSRREVASDDKMVPWAEQEYLERSKAHLLACRLF
jgi:hypothetical protein